MIKPFVTNQGHQNWSLHIGNVVEQHYRWYTVCVADLPFARMNLTGFLQTRVPLVFTVLGRNGMTARHKY